MTVPASSPLEPPEQRVWDETSWPAPNGRRVGAFLADDGNWEVLHVGFRFEQPHNGGVHVRREAAEVVAAALAVVLNVQVTV